jgi:hypothetical protein
MLRSRSIAASSATRGRASFLAAALSSFSSFSSFSSCRGHIDVIPLLPTCSAQDVTEQSRYMLTLLDLCRHNAHTLAVAQRLRVIVRRHTHIVRHEQLSQRLRKNRLFLNLPMWVRACLGKNTSLLV